MCHRWWTIRVVIVPTPKIYWVFIVMGALAGGAVACSVEHSKMQGQVKGLPAESLTQMKGVGDLAALGPVDQCAAFYEGRHAAGSESVFYAARPEECRAYRTYRDIRGPMAAVYALFGSIIGMFAGMFVNRRLRTSGKLPGWVG